MAVTARRRPARGPRRCASSARRQRRRAARAQLPAAGDPGRRRPHRRLAGALADRGPRRRRRRSCSAACTSWPRPRRSSRRTRPCSSRTPRAGCSLADSITADQLRAWKAEHPGRGRGVLREHHRRGEGRDRRLLHVVERGRGGGVDPGGPRGAVPARPVPRRARATGHRAGEHARLGGGVPRPRRASTAPTLAAQVDAHPDAELFVHPECGCATSALYLAGAGAVPAERVQILSTGGMLDAARELVGARGAGGHRGRDAAPAAPGRARDRRSGR